VSWRLGLGNYRGKGVGAIFSVNEMVMRTIRRGNKWYNLKGKISRAGHHGVEARTS